MSKRKNKEMQYDCDYDYDTTKFRSADTLIINTENFSSSANEILRKKKGAVLKKRGNSRNYNKNKNPKQLDVVKGKYKISKKKKKEKEKVKNRFTSNKKKLEESLLDKLFRDDENFDFGSKSSVYAVSNN
ncbi:hypothetical protein AYI70_g1110, partial [Smittium culicis]